MKYDTPIKIYIIDEDEYKAGELNEVSWSAVKEDDGTSLYYCKWTGTYGSVKAAAMTQGVNESVSVKMPYAPKLYEALRSSRVVISKGAMDIFKDREPDRLNPDCYELFSGVENQNNRLMIFMLKRYEGK